MIVLGWIFKVGKKWQITISKLGPVLDIKPGDSVEFELNNGTVTVKKKVS